MWVNQYDKVRIVSLVKRTDRRRDMKNELIRIGAIDKSYNLYDDSNKISFFDAISCDDAGVFRSIGSHSCFLSHLQILEEASTAGESVLILQDDCDFLLSAMSYELQSCDVFYGGYDYDNGYLIGAHCMGFSAKAARLAAIYLRSLLDTSTPADETASREDNFNPLVRPPIDGSLVWFCRKYDTLDIVYNRITEQRSSRTDIGNQHILDRLPGFKHLISAARRVRYAQKKRAA